MPRKDRTGPPGGSGPGRGGGIDQGGRGRGRREGTRPGAGPGGSCVCPNCDASVPHQAGVPCYNMTCPQCGAKMIRG